MVDLSLHNFWRKSKAKPRVTGQEVSVCKLHNRNSAHQINARRAPQCFYVFDSVRVRSKARANCYDPIVTSTIILWSVDIHFAFEFAVLRNTLDKVATAVFSFSESVFFYTKTELRGELAWVYGELIFVTLKSHMTLDEIVFEAIWSNDCTTN